MWIVAVGMIVVNVILITCLLVATVAVKCESTEED
jgi:hypothetical protein